MNNQRDRQAPKSGSAGGTYGVGSPAAGASGNAAGSLGSGHHGLAVSPRVASILADVAAGLKDQADDIALTMVSAYRIEIPAYARITDESLLEDVHSVSAAMVRCWLTVMSSGSPVKDEPLVPLLEGARRRAAQGFDLQPVLRAFRIGIRVMWSEITASSIWRGRPLQSAMADVATWVLDFADQISTGVAAAFMDETSRLVREQAHRRSALLNVILSGPGSERIDGPDELDSPHCVVVARVQRDLSLMEMEQTGRALEESVGASLWTVRYRSIVASVGLAERSMRAPLRQRLARLTQGSKIQAVGMGGSAQGVVGTRQSYAEAIDALRIGPNLGLANDPVYDHQELAPTIALLADRDRARRFADEALAPLGDLIVRPWVLPTLEAFLVRQGRLKEVAAALGVHPSTVKYRLASLRDFIDSSVGDGDRAATLLLAVRIHHLLGTTEDEGASHLTQARSHGPPKGIRSATDTRDRTMVLQSA